MQTIPTLPDGQWCLKQTKEGKVRDKVLHCLLLLRGLIQVSDLEVGQSAQPTQSAGAVHSTTLLPPFKIWKIITNSKK